MRFSIGTYASERRLMVKEYDTISGESHSTEMDGEQLPLLDLHLLVMRPSDYERWGVFFEQEERSYPVIERGPEFDLINLDLSEALELLKQEIGIWNLKNNLATITQQVALWEQLHELWPNDLILFCEELWGVLSRNLSTTYLRLIFPDVDDGEGERSERSERSKKKLIYRYIEGSRRALPVKLGGEAESRLMEVYGPMMQKGLQILEWPSPRGEFLAVINLRGMRIIMMAHLLQLAPIQNAWMKLFFDGLQKFSK